MNRRAALAFLAMVPWLPVDATAQEPRPWLLVELEAVLDDQPRSGFRERLEYGRFLGDRATLAASLAAHQVVGRPAGVAGGGDRVATATLVPELTGTFAVPSARLGLLASAGVVVGGPGGGSPATFRAQAHVRLDPATVFRLDGRRERYTWTTASLDTLVLANALEVALDRAGAPGWAGELVGRRQEFGDGNAVRSVYGWVLAPLSRSTAHSIRLGYALAWQDAERSTWAAASPTAAPLPDGSLPGRYAPYYSPSEVVTHSVVGAMAVAAGRGWIMGDGSVGFHATERAPVLFPGPTDPFAPELTLHPRSFTPYRLSAEWLSPLSDAASLRLGGAYGRTAYYAAGWFTLTVARSL